MRTAAPVKYVDRTTGETVVESVMGDKALRFAYETLLGRTLWPVLFGSKLISALMGRKYDSPRSKSAIAALAAIPGCRPDEAEKPLADYASFNEFFTRRLKSGARPLGEGVVSPADGRLRLYLNADLDQPFPLKGATRTLKEILNLQISTQRHRDTEDSNISPCLCDSVLKKEESPTVAQPPTSNLDIAVFRLAPVDYHRFHFPFDCETPEPAQVIAGKYHSVNPIALVKYPDVYADNERQIVRCETAAGSAWLVDVGAFGVGTIVQTYAGAKHAKGDEKGYFKFGGSTVILFAAAGALEFDADIVRNSAAGLETRVKALEKIAVFKGV